MNTVRNMLKKLAAESLATIFYLFYAKKISEEEKDFFLYVVELVQQEKIDEALETKLNKLLALATKLKVQEQEDNPKKINLEYNKLKQEILKTNYSKE